MKRKRICTGQWLVTVFILAISLSSYGCSDTVSVSEDVEVPLSSLTVTPGTLRPAFFSNTTNYAVNAPTSALSVTVTAVPKDSTVTMTINGIPTAAGQGRSVPLGPPGSITRVPIVLNAQNGTDSTYTVNVTRLLSSDNNLSALDVTPGNLNPPFDQDIEDYTVNVGVLVGNVTVSATKSDPNAVMSGSVSAGAGTASGQATIQLGGPGSSTPVEIIVRAPNGSTKTYRITVNRLSGDNNLRELTVTPGTFNRPFQPGITDYIVDVTTDIERVTVTATKSDTNAAMSGSVTAGSGTASGTERIPLGGPGSETNVVITVAAPDPSVPSKDYHIIVKRASPAAPPAPTVAPDLVPEDDSCLRIPFTNQCFPGTSDEDNITNVTTPRFRIPQPGAGETPSLYVSGVKVVATFDQGTNTLKPTGALSNGTYPITYTVANIGGESAQSPPVIVTIDTIAP